MKRLYSLQAKLTICFSILLFFATVIVCGIYYYSASASILKNTVESSSREVEYIINNTDDLITQCEHFSDWTFLNRNFDKTLLRDYTNNDKLNFNADIYKSINVLAVGVRSSSLNDYIKSIILAGNNGVRIRYGEDSVYIPEDKLLEYDWFIEGKSTNSIVWGGIIENPATQTAQKYVLPLCRSVVYVDTKKNVGWQLINISTSLISDPLEDYSLGENDYLFVLDHKKHCIYSSDAEFTGSDMSEYFDGLFSNENNNDIIDFQGRKSLSVWNRSEYTGFYVIQMTDYDSIHKQNVNTLKPTLTAFFVILISSLLLVFLISAGIAKPIGRISYHIKQISNKHFEPDPLIDGTDEIGILGSEINTLGSTVEQLLIEAKAHERLKESLELKILQNQINPHFIYNALNSIKIMAEFQKADGIYNTATALGELMRETAKGASDEITIERELFLAEKYLDIQKIRKKGMIRGIYNIDESLLQCRILKFLLQPIIENSVIHGLSNKKGMGIITITVKEQDGDILLSVEDNGIGIPPEKLAGIITLEPEISGDSKFNSIGLKNVSDRIRLAYGEAYGLEVQSTEGIGTVVYLKIPKR